VKTIWLIISQNLLPTNLLPPLLQLCEMLLFFSFADSFVRSEWTSTICFDPCCTLELLDVTWSGSRILLLSLSLIVFISSSSWLRVTAFQYFAPRAAMLADGSSLADKLRKSCWKNHLQSRGMGRTGSSFTPPLQTPVQFGHAGLAKPSIWNYSKSDCPIRS